MKTRGIVTFLVLIAASIVLTGCGGERRYTVSGSVSYQGEAIQDGTISFVPADTSLSPDGAAIVAGQYSCKVRAGKHTVKIAAVKVLPPRKGEDPTIINYKDLVPAKYNNNSTLSVEIKGSQKEDFNLQ